MKNVLLVIFGTISFCIGLEYLTYFFEWGYMDKVVAELYVSDILAMIFGFLLGLGVAYFDHLRARRSA